jgi:hypothetical protein
MRQRIMPGASDPMAGDGGGGRSPAQGWGLGSLGEEGHAGGGAGHPGEAKGALGSCGGGLGTAGEEFVLYWQDGWRQAAGAGSQGFAEGRR